MSKELTLGSLFDGCGGFPLAAKQFNIKTLWSSEIDPACLRITKRHFPETLQVGDITKLSGRILQPVDIITFGSPCQDLSIAGNRAGLAGEKSSLFLEAIRIIDEMREATNGEYPRFAVWENVAGAFSSNNGEDFKKVIEAFTKAKVPLPESGHRNKKGEWVIDWAHSGMVWGDSFEVAWRLFDAQYWGVPQRRARIYLVADFGGRCAGEILFKPESVSRYFKESRETWQALAGAVGKGITYAVRTAQNSSHGWGVAEDVAYTLDLANGQAVCNPVARTLNACKTGTGRLCADVDNFILAFQDNTSAANSAPVLENICPSLITKGSYSVLPAYAFLGGNSPTASGIGFEAEVSPTLKASGSGTNQIPDVLYNGTSQSDRIYSPSGVAPTIKCQMTGGPESVKIIVGSLIANGGTDKKRGDGGISSLQQYLSGHIQPVQTSNGRRVRRLTPTECERLQNYPDSYTKGVADSARYRMLGNSLALPCPGYVLGNIADILEEDKQSGT
jgi:DNA (cytosine-5)-methyltransferase 1